MKRHIEGLIVVKHARSQKNVRKTLRSQEGTKAAWQAFVLDAAARAYAR